MIELSRDDAHILRPMFGYTHFTPLRSFLDGCMGRAWADRADSPACARITIGDVNFLAGDPDAECAFELVGHVPSGRDAVGFIFVPENNRWAGLVFKCYGNAARHVTRYALSCGVFQEDRLAEYAACLPDGYSLEPIGEELYRQCLDSPMRDLCSLLDSAKDYLRRGIGFAAVKNGRIAGGASSYSVYKGGIEIEVDVGEEHRRLGLATACSARLILECLERGIRPNWDAANPESMHLALKLGYVFSHEYEVCGVF